MKSFFSLTLAVVLMTAVFAGCGQSSPNNSAPQQQQATTQNQTQANTASNNAAPASREIALQIWTYQSAHSDHLNERIAEYEQANPGITIEEIIIPSANDEYWQKLAAAVAAQTVPDIAYFHNQRISTFLDALEPYPEEIFPLEEMRANYYAFDAACMIDGKWYFFPIGIMDGQIYYHKSMFEEAGITEIPRTWDEFIEVGKKLTIYDANGQVIRAGFTSNGFYRFIWPDFFFQSGGQWYADDGKSVMWDSPAGLKATQMFARIIQEERIDTVAIENYQEAFITGMAAMTHSRGFFGGTLDQTYPEIDYGVFPIPIENENVPFLGRNNYECGFTVMRMSTEEKKLEAFKFLKALYTPEWIEFECSFNNRLPSVTSLWTEEFKNSTKVMPITFEQAPRTVFLGDAPQVSLMALENMVQNLYNGMDPQEALTTATNEANEGLLITPPAWVVEKEWKASIQR